MKTYYVYIATNKTNTVLYTGMSNTLGRRMFEHILRRNPQSFTAKYNINKLVYYDIFSTQIEAIVAEKKIKGWTRKRKVEIIDRTNPGRLDLFERDSSASFQNDRKLV